MNKMKYAIMFPGQGSQQVGMGKDIFTGSHRAKTIFTEAERVTGLPIISYTFDGPEEKLKQTNITQPCLLTTNISLYEEFIKNVNNSPAFLCGHSAGEYAALYASKVLNLEDCLKLIAWRGKIMNELDSGSMLAIINADDYVIEDLCQNAVVKNGVLGPANWNSKGQTVISGDIESIENAMEVAFNQELTAFPLPVSGAFHSEIMRPAVERFRTYLKEVTFNNAKVPVIANVSAKPLINSTQWRDAVLDQIISPVKWRQTIEFLYQEGIRVFLEIGPGNVLSKLVSRDYPDATVLTVNNLDGVQKATQYFLGDTLKI